MCHISCTIFKPKRSLSARLCSRLENGIPLSGRFFPSPLPAVTLTAGRHPRLWQPSVNLAHSSCVVWDFGPVDETGTRPRRKAGLCCAAPSSSSVDPARGRTSPSLIDQPIRCWSCMFDRRFSGIDKARYSTGITAICNDVCDVDGKSGHLGENPVQSATSASRDRHSRAWFVLAASHKSSSSSSSSE